MSNRRDFLRRSGSALLTGSAALPIAADAAELSARAVLDLTTPMPLYFPVLASGFRSVLPQHVRGVVTYRFDWGDGTHFEGDSPFAAHPYDSPGSYTIRLTVKLPSGRKLRATRPIVVTASPEPPNLAAALQTLANLIQSEPLSAGYRTALLALLDELAVDAAALAAALQAHDGIEATRRYEAAAHTLEAIADILLASRLRGELTDAQSMTLFVEGTAVLNDALTADYAISINVVASAGRSARQTCSVMLEQYGRILVTELMSGVSVEQVCVRLGFDNENSLAGQVCRFMAQMVQEQAGANAALSAERILLMLVQTCALFPG